MKRFLALTMALVMMLTVLSGCQKASTNKDSQGGDNTQGTQSTQSAQGTISQPKESDTILVFNEAVLSTLPEPMSQETREQLLAELNQVFSQKQYGEQAETLIRSSMELLMDNYMNFQIMFSFLGVPDAETYIRDYFITPLRVMVNKVNVTNNAGNGSSSDYNKTMTISQSSNADMDATVVIHELWHMAVCIEHSQTTVGRLYFHLNEGGATFMQLTLTGSKLYESMINMRTGAVAAINLNNREQKIEFIHFGSFYYANYFAVWYKLLTLTDFDTMKLFLKPNGDLLIRQAMIDKYGEEGGHFYDLLLEWSKGKYPKSPYDSMIEIESIYLRLLKGRLNEIESEQEMLAFLQMYRITRLAFGSEYVRDTSGNGVTNLETIIHPDLDYVGFDKAVADEVYKWHILNKGNLTDEQEYALAYAISAYPSNTGIEEYRKTRSAMYSELPICTGYKYSITVMDSENIRFKFYFTGRKYNHDVSRYYNINTGTCINFEKR